jgi:thioredoxin 1
LATFLGVAMVAPRNAAVADGEMPAGSDKIVHIENEEQFRAEVLDSSLPCLVDFYADWCGPCRRLGPVLEELAEEVHGKAKVVKINVDKNGDLAQRFGVRSIPDVRLFADGEESEQIVGVRRKEFYKARLLGE